MPRVKLPLKHSSPLPSQQQQQQQRDTGEHKCSVKFSIHVRSNGRRKAKMLLKLCKVALELKCISHEGARPACMSIHLHACAIDRMVKWI